MAYKFIFFYWSVNRFNSNLFSKSFNNNKVLILPSLIIIILYFILNFHYLNYQVVDKPDHYTPLEIKFFISYFFNMFFGSIYFGGLMLLIFVFFLFDYLRKNFKLNKFNLTSYFIEKKIEDSFLIIILVIYSLLILYLLFVLH